jgi:ankyrin repeat protein
MNNEKTMVSRIATGRTDLVIPFLNGGGSARAEEDGAAVIYWCARYGDVTAVRILLEHGEKLTSLGPDLGLGFAAFCGHWKLCQYLIENGADPNRSDPDTGETPLHAALCKTNRPAYDRVVKALLDAGADPNRPTTPDVPTGAFMRDCRTKGETPLHRAAAFGSAETIQRLLDAGAKFDAKDMSGDSPLGWASWHTRPDAILRLLCYGDHRIHPRRDSTFDHGRGWGFMERDLMGQP